MRRLEVGVFLPIAKNGFIRSINTPPYVPSFQDNRDITVLAETLGFDYVFSMLKWRGFGGATGFWDSSFDSFSLMAALAAVTTRVNLIATVNPVLIHPTPMAKMAATIDAVSGGRLGLNLITGSTLLEYTQMGVLPPDYDKNRYTYATEWVQVLKRLWTEQSVTHKGQYFELEDCVSEPKPIRRPYPFLVCAGGSDEGLRFTAQEADYSFLTGSTTASIREAALRAKEIAASKCRPIKTAVPLTIVIRDTDSEAYEYWNYLLDGADIVSTTNTGVAQSGETRERSQQRGAALLADRRKITSDRPYIGSPERVAEEIRLLVDTAELDSIVLMFPDYLDGLKRFAAGVLPILRSSLDVGVTL